MSVGAHWARTDERRLQRSANQRGSLVKTAAEQGAEGRGGTNHPGRMFRGQHFTVAQRCAGAMWRSRVQGLSIPLEAEELESATNDDVDRFS